MPATPHGHDPTIGHGQDPACLGDRDMMPTAQRDQVRHGGVPAMPTVLDMMQIGLTGRDPTPREPAVMITSMHRDPDLGRDRRGRSRNPEHLPTMFPRDAKQDSMMRVEKALNASP